MLLFIKHNHRHRHHHTVLQFYVTVLYIFHFRSIHCYAAH